MTFNLFSIIVLFGAVQGLLISLYLFFSSSANKHQRNILAFFMLILTYNGFETTGWSTGFSNHYIFFDLFNFTLIFGLGPALFLYVRSFRQKLTRKDLWHFAFLILLFITRFLYMVYFILCAYKITPAINFDSVEDWRWLILEPLSPVIFCVYLFFSLGELRKIDNQTTALSAEHHAIIHKWLKKLLTFMTALGILWIVSLLAAKLLKVENGSQYYLIEVLLAAFIYWVGLMGYQRLKIISINQQTANSKFLDTIPEEEIADCEEALQNALQIDKVYLDPGLTVSGMASHTRFNAKLISAVLNQRLKKGFNELVNEYRLQEFKERATKTDWQHLTISGLAAECGFSSQASFQRIFKRTTGMSPSEYLKIFGSYI